MPLSSPKVGHLLAPIVKAYRHDIDGLRAVAVLSVVGFHCGVPWIRGGFIGVDIFFVISGYLICSVIYREIREGTFSIAGFYERRFKRILPALFAVLLFCLVVATLVLSPSEARRLGLSVAASSMSLSNLYFVLSGDYFHPSMELNPLLMTWSLAVEEQFYLAFPLVMLLLCRLKKSEIFTILAGLGIFSLAISIYAEFRQPEWNFYLPVTRAWELGAGALIAIWESGSSGGQRATGWKRDLFGVSGLVTILACIFLYKPGMRFPGFEAVPPVLGTILVIFAGGGFASRVLAIRPLVAVGLISYSLYLWHWPLLSFARILSPIALPPQVSAIVMALAFAAAVFSYYYIEKPFRSRKYAGSGTVLLSYGAVSMGFILLGGVFYLSRGLPQRVPQLAMIEKIAGLDRHHRCLVMSDNPNVNLECVPAISSSPAIALLGDSHAEAVESGLQHFASARGLQLLVLTKSNCPPLQGVTRWHPIVWRNAESCRRFNEKVASYILTRPDIEFVFLTGSWSAPGGKFIVDGDRGDSANLSLQQSEINLRQGLQAEVATFESMGKQVILMDDVPVLPIDPMRAVRYNQLPVRRALTRLLLGRSPDKGEDGMVQRSAVTTPAAELASMEIASLKAADHNLIVIDPKAALCDANSCRFADEANVYYTDEEHLSPLGAAHALSLLQSSF
jgi:peptidoglycan/LPS O-acetylase OafA/YrhL